VENHIISKREEVWALKTSYELAEAMEELQV
jgi:hypothetical protein